MGRLFGRGAVRFGVFGILVSVCVFQASRERSVLAQEALQVLFLRAVDEAGAPVLDLTTEEIIVRQDGTACAVVTAQPETRGMKIALLVDNGRPADTNALREGLVAFIDTLPLDHEVGLFTIGGQIRRVTDFTVDRGRLRIDGSELHVIPNRGTKVIEGLHETWRRRFTDADAWPVFVFVLQDGLDASPTGFDPQFDPLMRELVQRGVTIHAVVVSPAGVQQQTALTLLMSRTTGGTHRPIVVNSALPVALTDLASAIDRHYSAYRSTYRVVFDCATDEGGGETAVGVDRVGVTFAAFGDRRMR